MKDILLKNTERLDDLQCKGYRIIQDKNGYCFTSDSVLLANLCKINGKDKVVDLCTGSGVIALLLNAKYSPKEVIGVELQPRLAEMAERSVALNGLTDKVRIICAPVQGIAKIIGTVDVVTVNPPYEKVEEVKQTPTEEEICKSEQKLTLEQTIKESASLLRYGGNFYMIHRAKRLAESIFLMKKYGIEPKKLYMVYPKKDKDADTFVIEGKRGGKVGLVVPKPIIVYDDNGEYTEEVRSLYNK